MWQVKIKNQLYTLYKDGSFTVIDLYYAFERNLPVCSMSNIDYASIIDDEAGNILTTVIVNRNRYFYKYSIAFSSWSGLSIAHVNHDVDVSKRSLEQRVSLLEEAVTEIRLLGSTEIKANEDVEHK